MNKTVKAKKNQLILKEDSTNKRQMLVSFSTAENGEKEKTAMIRIEGVLTEKQISDLKLDKYYPEIKKGEPDKKFFDFKVSNFLIDKDQNIELQIEDENNVVKKVIFNNKKIQIVGKKEKILLEKELESGSCLIPDNLEDLVKQKEIKYKDGRKKLTSIDAHKALTLEPEDGRFSVLVKENKEGKQTGIGYKKTRYGEKENVFKYSTSSNKSLMEVSLEEKSNGEIKKTLKLNNKDGKFDAFKDMIKKNPEIGTILNDEITVIIENIKYNPNSEITVSFEKEINVDGAKYKSMDVLSNSVVLTGPKRSSKPIFIAEKGEVINQELPSNFFELFEQKKIKGERIPSQQLHSLIRMSKETGKLPKGVLSAESYQLTQGMNINVLKLKSSSNAESQVFIQLRDEAVRVNKVYKVLKDGNEAVIAFGLWKDRQAQGGKAVGENKRGYQLAGIDATTSEFERFNNDIIENIMPKDQIISPAPIKNTEKVIVNKFVGDLNSEAEQTQQIEPQKDDSDQKEIPSLESDDGASFELTSDTIEQQPEADNTSEEEGEAGAVNIEPVVEEQEESTDEKKDSDQEEVNSQEKSTHKVEKQEGQTEEGDAKKERAPQMPADPAPYQRRKGRGGLFKIFKYIAYGLGVIGFIGLGAMMLMTPGIGILQSIFLMAVGVNVFQSLGASIVADTRKAVENTQNRELQEANLKIKEIQKDVEKSKEIIESQQSKIEELYNEVDEEKNKNFEMREELKKQSKKPVENKKLDATPKVVKNKEDDKAKRVQVSIDDKNNQGFSQE